MRMFAAFVLVTMATPSLAQTWSRAHGGADQAGFANVNTLPITDRTPVVRVAMQGPFAPDVGPVVGVNGIAYIATLDGSLVVVRSDGTTTIPHPGRHAYTAPLIGDDGAVYLATSYESGFPPSRDHRSTRAWLTRYSPQGVEQWERPLPKHVITSGAAMALNAVGTGVDEVILVAARERLTDGATPVNLVGLSRSGDTLFSQDVGGGPSQPVNGSLGEWTTDDFCLATAIADTNIWFPPCSLEPVSTLEHPELFLPASLLRMAPIDIAIAANNTIVVADGYRGIRGYTFTPKAGLVEVFEKIDRRDLTTPVAILPSQRSVYGVAKSRIAFAGPSNEHVADILHDPGSDEGKRVPIIATPTRLADGKIVTIGFDGKMTIVANVVPSATRPDAGAQTVAAVAASRNGFYVSVRNALVSFDAATGARTATFSLLGGLYPPAIGRDGRVYVLTDDRLLIFSAGGTSSVRQRPVPVHGRPRRFGPAILR